MQPDVVTLDISNYEFWLIKQPKAEISKVCTIRLQIYRDKKLNFRQRLIIPFWQKVVSFFPTESIDCYRNIFERKYLVMFLQ